MILPDEGDSLSRIFTSKPRASRAVRRLFRSEVGRLSACRWTLVAEQPENATSASNAIRKNEGFITTSFTCIFNLIPTYFSLIQNSQQKSGDWAKKQGNNKPQ